MTLIIWFAGALLTVDVVLITALLAYRLVTPLTSSSISEIAPLFVLAGVLTALVAFVVNLRRGRSEDTLEAAMDLLEKAYQALTGEGAEPTNRRHAWLSAARLIATAEKLSQHIVESSHRTIYTAKREYWRGQLYDLIFPSPPEGLPSSFYAERPEHMVAYSGRVRAPLSEKSLAYLYRFIRWPEGMADSIGEEPVFTPEEIERMRTFGPRGLGALLAEARSPAHN
jgi:hypothetical protein